MEVPLRATQATDDMRRMMTVFRLNPFASPSFSHPGDSNGNRRSGSVGSSSSSESDSPEGATEAQTPSPPPFAAQPLEEEPQMFEFQVALDDPEGLVPEHDRVGLALLRDGHSKEDVQLESTQPLVRKGNEYASGGAYDASLGKGAYDVGSGAYGHGGAMVMSPLSSPPLSMLDVSSDEASPIEGSHALHSFPPDFEPSAGATSTATGYWHGGEHSESRSGA